MRDALLLGCLTPLCVHYPGHSRMLAAEAEAAWLAPLNCQPDTTGPVVNISICLFADFGVPQTQSQQSWVP